MTRREAREEAFLLLFEWEFNKRDLDEILQCAAVGRSLRVDEYARKLAAACLEHMEEIDHTIEQCSQNWRLNRIGKVALAVLRLSVCELIVQKDVPLKVSINEAVEITKKYAVESDASFVNGVLGAVAKQLEEAGKQPAISEC